MTTPDALNQIAVQVGKLEGLTEANAKAIGDMAASVTRLVDKLERSDDTAKEALQNGEYAHKRLNDAFKKIEDLQTDIKTGRRYQITTTIGFAGLFLSAAAFIWNLFNN